MCKKNFIQNRYLVFLFFVLFTGCYSSPTEAIPGIQSVQDTIPDTDTVESVATQEKTKDTITIIGVGDIMLGTIVPSRNYLPKNNDCAALLHPTKAILSNADVTFGNLEGTLTDSKVGAKHCRNPKVCYTFGMPTAYAKCLADAGFDLISVANNHSGDFGTRGRQSTIKALQDAELTFAGYETHPKGVYEKDGVKYGFCAFAPNRGTCSIKDIDKAKQIVEELEKESDIVIVSFHGGAEGSRHQHVPRRTEIFLGENRGDVYKFSRAMIDAGADVIFGHGPHVTRAIDFYKDRFIIYSMGNYCTYSRINISGVSGLAPIVEIATDKHGKFLKGKIHPTYQVKGKGPQIDPDKRVIKVIQRLTKSDIPEVELSISDNGEISRK